MEKADESGFVNIVWPSKNVPHGGIFHTRTFELSPEQQQLQKEESKLNMKLQQSCSFGLRAERKKLIKTPAVADVEVVRPCTSRRRSLSAIRSSGVLDVDIYRPVKKGVDRELMKEILANNMAFGDSTEQSQQPPITRHEQKKLAPQLPTAKETWNDLVNQIRERAEWLAEMEWLGEASPHREILQGQIAERMRALDALGVDSVCSTARSTADTTARSTADTTSRSTARSTSRSTAGIETSPAVHTRSEACRSKGPKAVVPIKGRRARDEVRDEHVAAYSQLTPLRYSPRRRV